MVVKSVAEEDGTPLRMYSHDEHAGRHVEVCLCYLVYGVADIMEKTGLSVGTVSGEIGTGRWAVL